MKIYPSPSVPLESQYFVYGNKSWSVARLIQLTKNFEIFQVPIAHLNIGDTIQDPTLRDLAGYFQAVKKSRLKYPIILDQDGHIMDGRHRIVKAIMKGKSTIKAVRFELNPEPCEIQES